MANSLFGWSIPLTHSITNKQRHVKKQKISHRSFRFRHFLPTSSPVNCVPPPLLSCVAILYQTCFLRMLLEKLSPLLLTAAMSAFTFGIVQPGCTKNLFQICITE